MTQSSELPAGDIGCLVISCEIDGDSGAYKLGAIAINEYTSSTLRR